MTIWLYFSSYKENRSTGQRQFPRSGNPPSGLAHQGTGFQTCLLVLRFRSTLSCLQAERLRPWGINPYMKTFLISCPIKFFPVLSTVDFGQKQRGVSICAPSLNGCMYLIATVSNYNSTCIRCDVFSFGPDLKMRGYHAPVLFR